MFVLYLCTFKKFIYVTLNYKLYHSRFAFRSTPVANLPHRGGHFPTHSTLFFTLPLGNGVTSWFVNLRMAGMYCSVLPARSRVLATCMESTSSSQKWRLCLLWFSISKPLSSHIASIAVLSIIKAIFRPLSTLAFIFQFFENPSTGGDHSLLGASWETPIALVNLGFMVCIYTWYLHTPLVINTYSCLLLFYQHS